MAREATAAPAPGDILTHSVCDPITVLSDEQLLKRFLQGTEGHAQAAFADLIERHDPIIHRVCLDVLGDRAEAQDAAQVVFLVLARKARSIRKPASLGPWLHGVALRVARRLRRETARRRAAERRKAEIMHQHQSTESRHPPMDHAELHEEIDRLPEKYRRPIILCYMQGQTQVQAAETLGWPLGTVQIRLHRGRERLRSRLLRREGGRQDLSSSALLTSLIVAPSAPERTWSESTAHAAVRFAAGQGTSGLVAPAVTGLAESTLAAMFYTPLKIFTLLTLAPALVGAGFFLNELTTRHHPQEDRSKPRQALHVDQPPHTAPATILVKKDQAKSSLHRGHEPATPLPAPTAATMIPRGFLSAPGPLASPGPSPSRSLALAGDREGMPRSGRELFERVWLQNDPRSHGGDGLGPVFNAQSCVACHSLGGAGGAGGLDRNIEIVSVTAGANEGMGFSYGFSMDFGTGRFEYKIGGYPDGSTSGESPAMLRGMAAIHPGFRDTRSVLLHRYGIDSTYNLWRQTVPGQHGLALVQVSERNTPPLFGAGLIDAIPDAAIEAAARRRFSGQSAVKGRVSRLKDGRIGRFGWKAQTATLEEFVLSAAAGEMGLEVPGRHQGADPRFPGLGARGLDMDQADCNALVKYVRSLPAPITLKPADLAQLKSGEEVFRSIGCAGCHLPKLGDVSAIYSDLLLHDMGPRLADADAYTVFADDRVNVNANANAAQNGPGGSSGSATVREWRTPPLWGLRHSAPYLHDGRAATIAQAIALHAGQGSASAKRYADLSPRRKQLLEVFLMSLASPAAD